MTGGKTEGVSVEGGGVSVEGGDVVGDSGVLMRSGTTVLLESNGMRSS